MQNKNVKVSANGTLAVAILVQKFGLKKVDCEYFSPIMVKQAQIVNVGIKKAAYEYFKAVYMWAGNETLKIIKDLKNAQ